MKLTNEAYNKILLIISARLELMKELSGFVPSLENIKPAIEDAIAFSGIDCDEEDKNKLLEEIEYREKITHVLGNIIYDDYEQKKWYFNDKVDDSYFWERYYRYLKEHTSSIGVSTWTDIGSFLITCFTLDTEGLVIIFFNGNTPRSRWSSSTTYT